MNYVYMDSGTSNTRAYLVRFGQLRDTESRPVGTKDSALHGSNEVLLRALRDCYDALLGRAGLRDGDIASIWMSGMVTNSFGIVEVEHASTPVSARTLAETAWAHEEKRFFGRALMLIRGVKTARPGQKVTFETLPDMNNLRGEETEAVGMAGAGLLAEDSVVISPGSHTHMLRMQGGAIVDILSTFTGELSHAIRAETILGAELSKSPVMEPGHVLRGYEYLRRYGLGRALYILHASRVFDMTGDDVRAQMLEGIITGSVIDLLGQKVKSTWKGVRQVVVIDGGQPYVQAYGVLIRHILPEVELVMQKTKKGDSFALRGFLEILREYQNIKGEI